MAFECVNVMKCIDVIKIFFSCWYTWWFTDPINPGRSNRPSLSTKKSSVLLIQLDDMKNAIFQKKNIFRRKFWINKLPLINYTNLWVIPSLQILALTMSKVTLFWLVEKYHHTDHLTVGTKINSLKGGSFQFHDTKQVKEPPSTPDQNTELIFACYTKIMSICRCSSLSWWKLNCWQVQQRADKDKENVCISKCLLTLCVSCKDNVKCVNVKCWRLNVSMLWNVLTL